LGLIRKVVDGSCALSAVSPKQDLRREKRMDGSQAEVFVGIDMAKTEHYAQAITTDGVEVFDRPIGNDQAVIEAMLD